MFAFVVAVVVIASTVVWPISFQLHHLQKSFINVPFLSQKTVARKLAEKEALAAEKEALAAEKEALAAESKSSKRWRSAAKGEEEEEKEEDDDA